MSYFSETELNRYATEARYHAFGNIKEARERDNTTVTIFLSHSHKDRALALGFIRYMETLGIKIYVDWNDQEMPRITNRETANRIKAKIHENKLFMVLATGNAIDSKWVPWEVGIADQAKGAEQILIVPVTDYSGNYRGAEYLQLYREVKVAASGGRGVFYRGATEGLTIEGYLKAFGV
jgi:hypothetical protein